VATAAAAVEGFGERQAKQPATAAAEGGRVPVTRDGRRAVVLTTIVCTLLATAGHVTLLVGWMARPADSTTNLLPWQPVVGVSLAGVAVVAFGGFYHASLRARIAIMSSFVLTFLLLLTFVLTVQEINAGADLEVFQALFSDFRWIVQTIIAFYFVTETTLSLTKIIRAPAESPAAQRRADRDLPAG
jgi:hypothetical protein